MAVTFALMNRPSDRYRTALICAFLAVLTFLVYYQVLQSDFVNFDDTIYVTENRQVQEGLSLENVGWAFRSTLWREFDNSGMAFALS